MSIYILAWLLGRNKHQTSDEGWPPPVSPQAALPKSWDAVMITSPQTHRPLVYPVCPPSLAKCKDMRPPPLGKPQGRPLDYPPFPGLRWGRRA
eukprot:scaffold188276_cov56-Prasinocladus_malaysianus.AAC.1